MKTMPMTSAPSTAAMVTAFWPGVNPAANRRALSLTRANSAAGTRAIGRSERHVGDRRVRGETLVHERRRHLRVERRLGRGDHRVGQAALTGRGLGLVGGRGVLGLLDRVEGVAEHCGEAVVGRRRRVGRGCRRWRGGRWRRRQWRDGRDGGDHGQLPMARPAE